MGWGREREKETTRQDRDHGNFLIFLNFYQDSKVRWNLCPYWEKNVNSNFSFDLGEEIGVASWQKPWFWRKKQKTKKTCLNPSPITYELSKALYNLSCWKAKICIVFFICKNKDINSSYLGGGVRCKREKSM